MFQRLTPNPFEFKRENHFFSVSNRCSEPRAQQKKILCLNLDNATARQSHVRTNGMVPGGRKRRAQGEFFKMRRWRAFC